MTSRYTLAGFPYVTVRIGCHRCTRQGSYRLARLAEKYGADTLMTDVLGRLARDCELWGLKAPGKGGCGAVFVDVRDGPPPDEPAQARTKLRVVDGWKP